MPFENTFCDREGCGHNVPNHPNDEHCLKCDCMGFFSKNVSRDPLGDFYSKKIIDIQVAFRGDLDTSRHMVNDFPSMASEFFLEKEKNVKEFWQKLAMKKPDLANKIHEKIQLWNKYGKGGIGSLNKEESEVFKKLTHDGANYERELMFIHIMILSFLTTRFREFIRELLIQILEIEFKHYNKYQSLNHKQLESIAEDISESDIKKMLKKFTNEWNLDLITQENCNQFTEFFYRRNVFIHNNGFPNKRYRNKTGFKGSDDKLEITNEYLLQLIDVFSSYSEIIYEFFLQKECNMVNINKKGNSHHMDLTKGEGRIIPIKDRPQ